jgi:pimeloyl-ACP methyl ester carboxylesterase
VSPEPPLVLVHGYWHGAWCWEERFAPYLRRTGWDVHARDLPCHGGRRGEGAVRWLSVRTCVDDLAAFTSTLPRPPVLVGHSLGGLVVQKYLERHRAAAGVLLAPVPPAGVWRATLRLVRREPRRFARSLARARVYPLVETPELARRLFLSPGVDGEELRRFHAALQDDSFRAFLDMLLLALPRPERVTTPVRVLGAADDALFSPDEVRATARAYGVTATIVPGMAHDMMLEPGWQDVADTIAGWARDTVRRAPAR